MTEKIRKKRPFPNGDILSDSSSTASDSAPYSSSPLTAPTFSDPVVPGSSHSNRSRLGAPALFPLQKTNSNKRLRSDSNSKQSNGSWRSPQKASHSSHRPASVSLNSHPSFVSDTATIPLPTDQSPLFSRSSEQPIVDDDSDNDLPMHSFSQRPSSSQVISTSPRTPPPSRKSKPGMAGGSKSGAADLLLYLANSPSRSPAPQGTHHYSPTEPSANAPSTPPSSSAHLPSSVLATPSNTHNLNTSLFNGALTTTPGPTFNFADFVNVTPSPAQLPWGGRTPGTVKTPGLAARVARKGLNFDALVPPGSESAKDKQENHRRGLALELGEDFMPRR